MYGIIILACVGGLLWRLQYWPFDRSYKYLPKFGDNRQGKAVTTTGVKPAE